MDKVQKPNDSEYKPSSEPLSTKQKVSENKTKLIKCSNKTSCWIKIKIKIRNAEIEFVSAFKYIEIAVNLIKAIDEEIKR